MLVDAAVYRVDDLAELDRLRWQVETALAHLKTTMQMQTAPPCASRNSSHIGKSGRSVSTQS
jgi:hypothetical protein